MDPWEEASLIADYLGAFGADQTTLESILGEMRGLMEAYLERDGTAQWPELMAEMAEMAELIRNSYWLGAVSGARAARDYVHPDPIPSEAPTFKPHGGKVLRWHERRHG
jgi:hypothetical protein